MVINMKRSLFRIAMLAVVAALALAPLGSCAKPEQEQAAAELLDLGEKYLLEMNYSQAAVKFMRAIEIEPKNPRAYIGAAEAFVGLGDTARAVEILKAGLDELPGDPEIQAMLGTVEEAAPAPEPEPEPTSAPTSAPAPVPTSAPVPAPTPQPTAAIDAGVASDDAAQPITSDTETGGEGAKDAEPTGASIYEAYYDVLKSAIDDYGVFRDAAIKIDVWEEGVDGGVAYTDLIDFDGDGTPELLYCADPDPSAEVYGFYTYHFYIYSYDIQTEKAIKLAVESMDDSSGSPGFYIDVTTGSDGRKYIFTYGNSGSMSTGGKVSTVASGKWQELIEFYTEDYEEAYYEINNRAVSAQEYGNILALYDSGDSYGIDGRSFSGWGVRDFLEELRLGRAPQWSKFLEKKRELNEWFSSFYEYGGLFSLDNFNANNYDKDKLIQFALLHSDEGWRDESGDEEYVDRYSIDRAYIDETIDRVFGIKEITREPGITNIYELVFDDIEYRDGRYYVEFAYHGSYSLYVQTVNWINDGDGTYSAQLDIYSIDIVAPKPINPYDDKEQWHGYDIRSDTNEEVYLGHLQPSYTAAAVVRLATYNGEQVYQLVELVEGGTIGDLTMIGAAPPAPPAKPTSSAVLVNGRAAAFDAYNIDDSNYFKLRDLAFVLTGSEKQFDVAWDGASNAILLASGKPYTPVGGEMAGKGAGDKRPAATTSKIMLDGNEAPLTAYNIDGNNYFKLRDVAEALDFGVTWDGAAQRILIDTGAAYAPD